MSSAQGSPASYVFTPDRLRCRPRRPTLLPAQRLCPGDCSCAKGNRRTTHLGSRSNMVMGTRRIRLALATAASGLTVGALFAPAALASPDGTGNAYAGHHQHNGDDGESDVTGCSDLVSPGSAYCHAHKRTDTKAVSQRPSRNAGASPNVLGNNGAYDPAFLRPAYNLAGSTGGTGKTVAIVDAFDDPKAATDLAYSPTYFGIPLGTGGNGTFTKVDQRDGTAYPAANYGWSQEISLDLDMVSAICPKCNILLVEADSNSLADLGTAVNRAVAMGAMAVSNSYGAGEYSSETTDSQTYFNHPGAAVTASSGDTG